MALEKFNLATLADMDGARTITLQVKLKPVANDAGDLGSVDVTFDLNEKLPKRASKSYNMQAVVGGLLFNELSPDEVKQKTLDMAGKNPPTPVADGKARGAGEAKEVANVG